ncbi:SMT3/SUMO-activating complex, AOS1/RAD31 component [Phaffia rhodozyma]|uniref:SMT3/SUMO-activating complex, AOS1/RAD31 component n=1 Tax=Phaffia rhodozyma TaxID=264483 RepID=A0A0F7SGD7_PHARH|nr:SMT3/SUMO-activating complex, AOS1/RAD31 component [Phaffia rhodozyma]
MTSSAVERSQTDITESEAAVYDRQIRLWGLEAQQRMRNSTVLIIGLQSLAAETIKNIVLAGIGRLIIMDSQEVTERDLGAGFLFRERDGVVGQKRVTAALPQIQSLNPLVTVTALTATTPFIYHDSAPEDQYQKIQAYIKEENVDIVCIVEASTQDVTNINDACRQTKTLFYSAATYGLTGYIFSDLGAQYEFAAQSTEVVKANESSKMVPKQASCVAFRELWIPDHSPFKGKNKRPTLALNPGFFCALFALWDYEQQHGALPLPSSDLEGVKIELQAFAEKFRQKSFINVAAFPTINQTLINHLATHATHEFNPTSAVLGGILAQDILRAISRSGTPILNFLIFDGISVGEGAANSGGGIVVPWGRS